MIDKANKMEAMELSIFWREGKIKDAAHGRVFFVVCTSFLRGPVSKSMGQIRPMGNFSTTLASIRRWRVDKAGL